MSLRAVGNGATGIEEDVASSGAAFAKVISMSGVNEANKFIGIDVREIGKIIGYRNDIVSRFREIRIGFRFLVDDSPVNSTTEIFGDLFEV